MINYGSIRTNLFLQGCASLVVLSFLASGCSFRKDSGDEDKEAIETAEVRNTLSGIERENQENKAAQIGVEDVQLHYDELPSMGNYQLRVTWPEGIYAVVVRFNNEHPKKYFAGQTFTVPVFSGNEFTITLDTLNSKDFAVTRNLVIPGKVPIDHALSSIEGMTEPIQRKGGRLFIDEETSIKTNGYNLELDFDKIIVKKQLKIRTFDEGKIATADFERSNSLISIRGRIITGDIEISMVAANGKNGLSGAEIIALKNLTPPAKAGTGTQGRSESYYPQCNGAEKWDDHWGDKCGMKNRCVEKPGNGDPGQDAPPTVDGEPGEDAGSTGSIAIFAENLESANIKVVLRSGKPGIGGNPAPPFKGQTGGDPGGYALGCPRAQKGPDGADGVDGNPPKHGKPKESPEPILPSQYLGTKIQLIRL